MASPSHLQAHNARKRSAALVPIGSRFGTLTVIGHEIGSKVYYRVRCDCGVEKTVKQKQSLIKSKSCGCLTKKIISASRTRHGMTDTPTWKSWRSMHERCYLRAHKSFVDYGGRGIVVCDSWHRFENFFADMGERPNGMQLDRVDNNGNYEPGNCRWATPRQNCNNRRSCHVVSYQGEELTMSQWARRLDIAVDTLAWRLKNWSVDDALSRPLKEQINNRGF